MSVANAFGTPRVFIDKNRAGGIVSDWGPAAPEVVPDSQPTNTGVPDPAQVTANPAMPSPVVNALTPAGAVTAAADPASVANSVGGILTQLEANIPSVGSLNGLVFVVLLYVAWHLYTHHNHWKLALGVLGLDFYLAFFRTVTATSTTVTA